MYQLVMGISALFSEPDHLAQLTKPVPKQVSILPLVLLEFSQIKALF